MGKDPEAERPGLSSPKVGDAREVESPERVPARVPLPFGDPGPVNVGGTAVNGFPSYSNPPDVFTDSGSLDGTCVGVLNVV